ncbi:MAG TPA: polymer-forming cytoskeletal protein [Anaerolineaceae bacterium]|nr:polymer-forming cytoskeletal protein [Anaerolineaceae bacterium]
MRAKIRYSIISLILVFFILGFPASAFAQTPTNPNDQVVLGGTYRLSSSQTLNGDLLIIGGTATLDPGSVVNGDVSLTGGTLDARGTITGNINAMGGVVTLEDTAMVHGDINSLGAAFNRSEKAQIDGKVNNENSGNLLFNIPRTLAFPRFVAPALNLDFSPIWKVFWAIFQALAIAALAVLVTMFLAKQTQQVAQSIVTEPAAASGIGCLTVIVAPALIALLAITLILIPVSLVGILVLGIAILFGWIAVGLEVGNRLALLFKSEWAVPVAAGIGTLVITLLANILNIVPCIGWILPALLAMVGLGGVLVSQFGTRIYSSSPTTSYNKPVVPTSSIPPTNIPPTPPASSSENSQPQPPSDQPPSGNAA